MAFRCLKLIRLVRNTSIVHKSLLSTSIASPGDKVISKAQEYKTENNFVYFEDPDTFGTLSGKIRPQNNELEDEGDIKEERYMRSRPLRTQKLTIKQYSDLIKQYLKHKRLKEAIDVLEVRMLTEDKVTPENYIYNILIGACADVGYTKKAFKLFNEMKRRALKPTGDTYTSLFHACANSPWPADGLKHARNLRLLMEEKGVEPNLTNYNSMIKAFGRCGDLPAAFRIVDEMRAKKIKIRVHTFNHLLHACIADKDTGLRHALVVWRKMLRMREKPNIYTFNLMLKCVTECNLGSKEDIEELIGTILGQLSLDHDIKNGKMKQLHQETAEETTSPLLLSNEELPDKSHKIVHSAHETENIKTQEHYTHTELVKTNNENKLMVNENNSVSITFVGKLPKGKTASEQRLVPNLLSRVLNMDQVLSLQEVNALQDKFAVIGGQDDFLKEMQVYLVTPDIKTFTQMLPLIEETREAEIKLMETMKELNINADIDFYNMLIKKRCLRSDYEGAFGVKDIIEIESKYRKKKYRLKKKFHLKLDIMSYGVLALACNTKETAEKLLQEMKEKELKVNIQILGTLLRNGTARNQFDYIQYIMNVVNEENIKVNDVFLSHLENFNNKCMKIIENQRKTPSDTFVKSYKRFSKSYNAWLKDVDIRVLQPEHPWKQFRESYPETVQRQNVNIEEPKRYYKKSKRYIQYKI